MSDCTDKQRVSMVSPVSSTDANLFIHSLETISISKCPLPPKVQLGYIENTFFRIKGDGLDELFKNVNIIANYIIFIKEMESIDQKLPFLNCLVERKRNDCLTINVFQKPTLSEKYLYQKSEHAHSTKVIVAKSLINRVQKLFTELSDKETNEFSYIHFDYG